MVLGLIPAWLSIWLLIVLPVVGIVLIIALLMAVQAMTKRVSYSGSLWANLLLVSSSIFIGLFVLGIGMGTWAVAHFVVWNNSVPGQAQARSGHWEQRSAAASEWAGQPAYAESVEDARSAGRRSTAKPRIAVRCTDGEGLSVRIFPDGAGFGGYVTLAVVADGTEEYGQSLLADSVSTHELDLGADGTLVLADPHTAFGLLASAGTDTDLWAAPASTVRGGKVWQFDADWAAERLATYRDCDEALAAALGDS